MEFVFEFLLEISASVLDALCKSRKVPRIVHALLPLVLFLPLICLFLFGGFTAKNTTGWLGALFCWILAAVFLVLYGYIVIQVFGGKK